MLQISLSIVDVESSFRFSTADSKAYNLKKKWGKNYKISLKYCCVWFGLMNISSPVYTLNIDIVQNRNHH